MRYQATDFDFPTFRPGDVNLYGAIQLESQTAVKTIMGLEESTITAA